MTTTSRPAGRPAPRAADRSAGDHAARVRARLGTALDAGRRWTYTLLDPLDDDSLHRQFDRIMSPLVWDLGHIGNFEELWLLRALGDRSMHDPDLDRVYNPFDNPRWVRADLPLLRRPEATEYVGEVRDRVVRLLRGADLDDVGEPLLADGFVYHMVVQHEAQHQETMLQALDLREPTLAGDAEEVADAADPRLGLYLPATARAVRDPRPVDDTDVVVVPGGPFAFGAADPADLGPDAHPDAREAAVAAYDNERPRHTVDLPAFAIDRFPATARRVAAFIADGGYRDDRWWSERGRAWREETGHTAPQGWLPAPDGGWRIRRFNRVDALDPRELVEHVSYFEAEAFAAWCGGRLPTEQEWEKAAVHDPETGTSRPQPWGDRRPSSALANVDRVLWGPSLVGSYPQGASALGVEHLLGDGYEWTSSDFEPYPGYTTFPYPEYSEVFFGGDWKVLRGASWATRPEVARATFRNWDHPYRRQIFSGIRVAWDVGPDGRPVGRRGR